MPPRRASRKTTTGSGYTLVELLMVVIIGGLLMTGAATMMIAHMRSSSRSEAILRLQDAWSRIQYLLDQEIQEATGVPTTIACSSLTLTIPKEAGGTDTIVYSISGSNLMRSGPTINLNGTLNAGTNSEELVMTNVTSFCPTIVNGEVNYRIALRDATGVTYQNQSQPSGARTRSRVIN
jgi:prepilin-type N-terminal cleavage/methylation domain-containing protein